MSLILVDTSVWIDHIRRGDETLASRLEQGDVLTHPFVVGELALGALTGRERVIHELQKLPTAVTASDDEVLAFIARHSLGGSGIGLVDTHLLVAARLTADAAIWTRDKRLSSIATRLGLSADL